MDESILVTVRVVSYNAETTILETLESIKNQTYRNIELIVSDDCSQDNTVEVARKWIDENKERFVRTELLTVDHNTGVCANMNRSLKASRGVWIKGIAADDILLPNCIEDNLRYIETNCEAEFIYSKVVIFGDYVYQPVYHEFFFSLSAPKQYEVICFRDFLYAPSLFMSRETVQQLGGFDERIRNIEDKPFSLKATFKGYRLYFMDKETVKYRVSRNSLCHDGFDKLFQSKAIEQNELIFKYYVRKKARIPIQLLYIYRIRVMQLFESLHLNRSTPFLKKLYAIMLFPISIHLKKLF